MTLDDIELFNTLWTLRENSKLQTVTGCRVQYDFRVFF